MLVPTVAMLALGWRLRGSESARSRRGAQALWLGACLLSVVFFMVTFLAFEMVFFALHFTQYPFSSAMQFTPFRIAPAFGPSPAASTQLPHETGAYYPSLMQAGSSPVPR